MDSSNEERNFKLNLMNLILYLNHSTWPVPTVLSSVGLGNPKSKLVQDVNVK